MPKTEKKPKLAKYTTPVGTARWPRLNTPDTRFNAKGVYKVDLGIDEKDEDAVEAIIEAQLAIAQAMAAKEFPDKTLEPDSSPLKRNEETGELLLRAKTGATITVQGKDIPRPLPLFDAALRPLTDVVGGGSRVRLGLSMKPYARASTERKTVALYGVALYLDGVQVVTLRAPGADPTSMGFAAIEADDDQDPVVAGDPTDVTEDADGANY